MTGGETSGEWPAQDLEQVTECPLCRSRQRDLLLGDVEDNIFEVAPGRWNYWRCGCCASLWLDPRPTRGSIGRAYASYYTHRQRAEARPSLVRGWGRRLTNGYRNWRFGTRLSPTTALGRGILLVPWLRHRLDVEMRHLPRPRDAQKPGRLLDFGAGNGDFLLLAKSAGWDVVGVEPDPVAADLARSRGLHIVDSLAALKEDDPGFERITMMQVIEHLHDPVGTLESMHNLLKPGGQLWLDTPNAQSRGLAHFGRDWRGLEPPRHLFIPSWRAMETVLRDAGFAAIRRIPKRFAWADIAAKSRAVQHRRDPYAERVTVSDRGRGWVKSWRIRLDATASEYVTLIATRSAEPG